MNARLKAFAEEQQNILDRIQTLEKDESQQAMRASKQLKMEE